MNKYIIQRSHILLIFGFILSLHFIIFDSLLEKMLTCFNVKIMHYFMILCLAAAPLFTLYLNALF